MESEPTEALPTYPTRPGTRFPTGISVGPDGVNFCIYGRYATRVELLLYADATSPEPFQTVLLDTERHRSFFFWHVFVEDLPVGTHYDWRMDGPNDTAITGHRFAPNRALLDPWARAVSDAVWDRRRASEPGDALNSGLRAIVAAPLPTTVAPPQHPGAGQGLEGAVIYEMHVGGYTRHPSSGVSAPGTFAGLIEKIPYLQALGVTHVELLPVMAFDAQDVPASVAARGLSNYWGYSTHSFWAPHPGYCQDPMHAQREFREMVDAFNGAGIGVLLDVVFNHTAEGGEDGPTIHFKGLANDIFYHLDADDRRRYLDFTGCGNTLNCNQPLVTAFILQCLEYWVETLGVDGFRFDLASVFARGPHGQPLGEPPLPWAIEASPVLAELPLIAEAWDASGLYQVGAFPGMAWAEWNGRYRDVIRRFVRGDPGLIGEVATRIAGSADLYNDDGRRPCNSINFVTCHDGFTLADLVSYNRKHNEGNGEDDRDGSDDNLSWNCGVEGPTDDPSVLELRARQARNLLGILMLSRGVPMLLGGDEVLRSQEGNNNAWCQDNPIGWLDWELAERNRDMLRFTRELIALRRRHPSLTANRFFDGSASAEQGRSDITWHGAKLNEPLWDDPQTRVLAFTLRGLTDDEEDLHVVLNMSEAGLDAPLPDIGERHWHLAVDTGRSPPGDILARSEQTPVSGERYPVGARSLVVMEARV